MNVMVDDSFLPVAYVILILFSTQLLRATLVTSHITPKMCHVEDRVVFLPGGTQEARPSAPCVCKWDSGPEGYARRVSWALEPVLWWGMEVVNRLMMECFDIAHVRVLLYCVFSQVIVVK